MADLWLNINKSYLKESLVRNNSTMFIDVEQGTEDPEIHT